MRFQISPPSTGGSGQGQNRGTPTWARAMAEAPDRLCIFRHHPGRAGRLDQHDFDDLSVLRLSITGTDDDPAAPVYDFFVNVDNRFLGLARRPNRPTLN